MFKVFIAEKILRNIIEAESQRPNNSRSNLFKILQSAKNLYVAMDAPDFAWIKQLKDDFGLVADTTRTEKTINLISKWKNKNKLKCLDAIIYNIKNTKLLAINLTNHVQVLYGEN